MPSRKESLRFFRLLTKASRDSTTISGFLNFHQSFSTFDDITLDAFGVDANQQTAAEKNYLGPSPFKMFVSTYPPYEEVAFIIDGITQPYDRTQHDLEELQDQLWIVKASDDGTLMGTRYGTSITRKVATPDIVSDPITFYVNPTRINIVKRKLYSQIRTRGGWVFQHWGPQIGEILLEGTTGNILPPPPRADVVVEDLGYNLAEESIPVPSTENSPALRAFRQLEQWYDEDQNESAIRRGYLLALEYRGRIYVGHFKEFTFNERGENPFQLYYRLNFQIHYDAGDLSIAASRAQNRIIRNQETINYIRTLRDIDESANT